MKQLGPLAGFTLYYHVKNQLRKGQKVQDVTRTI